MSPPNKYLLKHAPQLNVHRWSDYPQANAIVAHLLDLIVQLRRKNGIRIREPQKIWKHLKVLVLDLWVARKLCSNPYRSISLNKTDYRTGTRYRKIFLKYDYLVGVLNDLVSLGYVQKIKGFRYREGGGVGYRTRIWATDKLVALFDDPELDWSVLGPASGPGLIRLVTELGADPDTGESLEPELIILRDHDGKDIDYIDTPPIVGMRANVSMMNAKIASAHLALRITDAQFAEIQERCSSEGRDAIDFTQIRLRRIFNNSSWNEGGRFYGGWWQNIPRDYRRYIEINHQNTIELDYSGHHVRMLYADTGVSPPDDPYDLPGFQRDDQKKAILIILNARSKDSAIRAMSSEGIGDAELLANAMEDRHKAISNNFYSCVAMRLMRADSEIAEDVMLKMMKLNAVVLPLHDSFIVRAGYGDELHTEMDEAFRCRFGLSAIKAKMTVLDEPKKYRKNQDDPFVDPEEVLNSFDEYQTAIKLFGYG